MSLIKCIECGKEISDKSKVCIHCGCPLPKKNMCLINGTEQDLSFLIDGSCNLFDAIMKINTMTGSCFETSCEIVSNIMKTKQIPSVLKIKTKQEYLNEKSQTKCPKCGSTEFTPVRKKFSLLTGFATNKVELICNKCGTKIKK